MDWRFQSWRSPGSGLHYAAMQRHAATTGPSFEQWAVNNHTLGHPRLMVNL